MVSISFRWKSAPDPTTLCSILRTVAASRCNTRYTLIAANRVHSDSQNACPHRQSDLTVMADIVLEAGCGERAKGRSMNGKLSPQRLSAFKINRTEYPLSLAPSSKCLPGIRREIDMVISFNCVTGHMPHFNSCIGCQSNGYPRKCTNRRWNWSWWMANPAMIRPNLLTENEHVRTLMISNNACGKARSPFSG